MPRKDRAHGRDEKSERDKYPLIPAKMAEGCREMASDLRREHARGMGPIHLTGSRGHETNRITRLEAATRLDQQAARWEEEARTGVPNRADRDKLGL
jgi:hypothetical protein